MAGVPSWLSRHVEWLVSASSGDNSGEGEVVELMQVGGGLNGGLTVLRGCLEGARVEEVPLRRQLLAAVIRQLLPHPNFATLLCEAVRQIRGLSEQLLRDLSHTLDLAGPEKLCLGLALASAEDKSRRRESQKFCASALTELLAEGKGHVSVALKHELSCYLHRMGRSGKHSAASGVVLPSVPAEDEGFLLLAPVSRWEGVEVDCLETFEPKQRDRDVLRELANSMDVGRVMEELGYECVADSQRCKQLLSFFPFLSEVDIGKVAGMISRTHSGSSSAAYAQFAQAFGVTAVSAADLSSSSGWNMEAVVDTIKELYPHVDWLSVMQYLDHEEFSLPDQKAFDSLLSFFSKACQQPWPFPMDRVCGEMWKNCDAEFSFIKYAVAASPGGSLTPDKRSAEKGWREYRSPNTQHWQWLSFDMSGALCQLAEAGHASTVRHMLEKLLTWNPGLVMIKLAQIKTAWNIVQSDLLAVLLPAYILQPDANHRTELRQLWLLNSDMVTYGLVGVHAEDPKTTPRLVDVCQKLEVLQQVLDVTPFSFSIDVAALAWRESLADLERWLEKHLDANKEVMVRACLIFLRDNASSSAGDSRTSASGAYLPVHVQALFFRVLAGIYDKDSTEAFLVMLNESPIWKEQPAALLRSLCIQYALFSGLPDRDLNTIAVVLGSLLHLVSDPKVLDMGSRCILDALGNPVESRMFGFGLTVLKQFKDRLKGFPHFCKTILKYPHPRESYGELIGGLEEAAAATPVIAKPLLTLVTSSEAPERFAIDEAFGGPRQQLHAPVQQLSQISSQPQFQSLGKREDGSQDDGVLGPVNLSSWPFPPGQEYPGQGGKLLSRPATNDSLASNGAIVLATDQAADFMGQDVSLNTLLAGARNRGTPKVMPDSEARNKITFILNNISTGNLELKANEFKTVLQEQYYLWFAQYLVIERASKENNFHDLYVRFLDTLGETRLQQDVIQETYENCNVLMKSNLLRSSTSERGLLKNLGAWLGKLTIGRNRCLKARYLDLKPLLVEATEKGLLFAVLPFVTRIMEPCQSVPAYRLPNPWTTAVLGLLAEIYLLDNLKMNLKFEIEILFNKINVDMKSVRPSDLLADRPSEADDNPDFYHRSPGLSQQVIGMEDGSSASSPQAEPILKLPPAEASLSSMASAIRMRSLAGHSAHLATAATDAEGGVLSHGMHMATQSRGDLVEAYQPTSPFVPGSASALPNLPASLFMNKTLAYLVQKGMERAIQETMQHILENYLVLACKTTQVLVMKDFATEESKAPRAAYLMVAGLAGRLSSLCKDRLEISMQKYMKFELGAHFDGAALKKAVELVTIENLSLAFAIVENATIRFALQKMKDYFEPKVSMRRQQGLPAGAIPLGTRYSQQGLHAGHAKPVHSSDSWQLAYEGFSQFLPPKNSASPRASPAAGQFSTLGTYSAGGEAPSEVADDELETSGRSPVGLVSTDVLFDEACQVQDKKMSPTGIGGTVVEVPGEHEGKSTSTAMPLFPSQSEPQGETNIDADITDDLEQLEKYLLELDGAISKAAAFGLSSIPSDHEAGRTRLRLLSTVSRSLRRDEIALALSQRLYKRLFEDVPTNLHIVVYVGIMESMQDFCMGLSKEITNWIIAESNQEKMFDSKVIVELIRSKLMYLKMYDQHLAKLMNGGLNGLATDFAIQLFRIFVSEQVAVNASDFPAVNECLLRLAQRPGSPKSEAKRINTKLRHLLEELKSTPSSLVREGLLMQKPVLYPDVEQKESGNPAAGGESTAIDLSSLRDQAARFFQKWMLICETAVSSDKVCMDYMSQLQRSGLLDRDDTFDLFFQHLLELAVTHSLTTDTPVSGLSQAGEDPSFAAIDTFAKLVVLLVRRDAEEPKKIQMQLLKKILIAIVRVICKDADQQKTLNFHPRVYFRLFVTWLMDFSSPEVDALNFQVLTAFGNALGALQPLRIPSWTFAWWDLVSHRKFMPKLLLSRGEAGWPLFHRLLICHLRFMEPYLRVAYLVEPMCTLYKGTLRVFLVLLHDFSEFLCAYYFSLCAELPPTCIQMRNLILSAFPRNIILPDPHSASLKVDMLPEMKVAPVILSDVDLGDDNFKLEVDQYLSTWHSDSSPSLHLKQRLMLSTEEAQRAGTVYNVRLLRALVLYVGMEAIRGLQTPTQDLKAKQIGRSAPMAIFHSLMVELDSEGRHMFCSALADQLRYPNSHTHYFSCVLLYLFVKYKEETWREQITRVLIERFVAQRPHPWGLQVTVIELARNSALGLWECAFMQDPQIRSLFASLLPPGRK